MNKWPFKQFDAKSDVNDVGVANQDNEWLQHLHNPKVRKEVERKIVQDWLISYKHRRAITRGKR